MRFSTCACLAVVACALAGWGLTGCSGTSGGGAATSSGNGGHDDHDHDHADHDHGHDHDHPVHGPRDGELIELGADEQYHAEWLLDEAAGTVTIYILDGAVEKDVPIDADSVTVEVTLDDQKQQHPVPAVRAEGSSQTAQFQADSKALVSLLKLVGKGTEAELRVDINGQPFQGKFVAHEHDHAH